MITTWQVGTPYGPAEQNVANMSEFRRAIVIDDMARRMTRTMQDLKFMRSERYPVALHQKTIRLTVAHGSCQPETVRLIFEICQQWPVILMRAQNFDTERVFEFHRAAGMINMSMREPDGCGSDAIVLQGCKNSIHVSAGIDDDTDLVLFIEKDGTILLKRRDGNDAGIDLTHDDPFVVGIAAVGKSPLM